MPWKRRKEHRIALTQFDQFFLLFSLSFSPEPKPLFYYYFFRVLSSSSSIITLNLILQLCELCFSLFLTLFYFCLVLTFILSPPTTQCSSFSFLLCQFPSSSESLPSLSTLLTVLLVFLPTGCLTRSNKCSDLVKTLAIY